MMPGTGQGKHPESPVDQGGRPLAWPGVRAWLDRSRRAGGGICHCGAGDPGGDLGCGAAAAISGQRAGHTEPGGHTHQPALQRGRHPGSAVPVLAAGTDRRPPGPGAHRRDPARRHRRVGHPGQPAARPSGLRPGGRRGAAPPRDLAGADPPSAARRTRPPGTADPGTGPGRAGGPRGLRRRYLRDRRRLDPGTDPDRVRQARSRGRPGRPGVHVRDLRSGRDHFHDLVRASSWPGGAELAHRDRAGYRRPGRRLHRCPDPVPAARRPDPPPGRRPGHRHRCPLFVARAGLVSSSLRRARTGFLPRPPRRRCRAR